MCICCCVTRKALLIYAIVITTLTVIYGIYTVAFFGSSTDIYKYLVDYLDAYDKAKEDPSFSVASLISNYLIFTNRAANGYTGDVLSVTDVLSYTRISNLNMIEIEKTNYKLIKMLKGFDNGLGLVLFILSILFLAAEIFYLVFVCGIRENQVASIKIYCISNILKIITYALSIICIFLSVAYGVLLLYVLIQYMVLLHNFDSCSYGILYGMIYSYYSFWVYVTLSCIFGKERKLFIDVGSVEHPGTAAMYDINGNAIVKAVVTSQVIALNPQVIVQPVNVPYQQVQVVNQNAPNPQNPDPQQLQGQVGTSERSSNKIKHKKNKK